MEYDGSREPTKIAGGAPGGGLRAWMELGEGRGGAQGTSGGGRKKYDRRKELSRVFIEKNLNIRRPKFNYSHVIHPISESIM